MNLLFLDSPSFAKEDMIDAFKTLGYHVDLFFHPDYRNRHSKAFETAFDHYIEKKMYDFVFSFNYCPILSICCNNHQIKYVSYVYDSPHSTLYSYTVINPCNYIFIFDQLTYQELSQSGISTVYFLPLAANPDRTTSLVPSDEIRQKLSCDISFVGSMYNESPNLFESVRDQLSPYANGFIESILLAQHQVYGYYFLQELLEKNDAIFQELHKAYPYPENNDGVESPQFIIAQYMLGRRLTEMERHIYLHTLSKEHEVHLYTHHPTPELPFVKNCGTIDFKRDQYYLFQCSRINLNISLRSIRTGIPLRCYDILGCGGFLLTNYQQDFFPDFVPREDYDYFESEETLVEKTNYYLKNNSKRHDMTCCALQKIRENHTFVHRAQTILSIIL